MCPVVLFPIVNHSKSTQSLYSKLQNDTETDTEAKPHLVNTHDSTLHLRSISSLDAVSRSIES